MLRRDASATTSSAGNLRSSRMLSISRPTLPVAPTSATLQPIVHSPKKNASPCQAAERKRQRFYARNAVKTTLDKVPGVLMRSISAPRAAQIHPALRSFADECSGLLARLIAYVGALA